MTSSPRTTGATGSTGLAVVVDPGRFWPLLALRGALAVLFGLLALLWPQITVLALALLFGAYALVDGAGLLAGAFRHPPGSPADRTHRLGHLLGGLLGIAAAVVTVVWPHITVLALTTVAGAWAVVTGVAEIVAAVRLRKQIRGESLLALAGAVSIVAGLLIWLSPGTGAVAIAVVLGVYALLFGVLLLALALRLRRLSRATT